MASAADDALASILKDDFSFQLSDNPEYASQSGVHKYDHQLQDLSPEAFERRIKHNEAILKRLSDIDPAALSSDAHRLRRALFLDNVTTENEAFALGCHLYPINSIGYGGVVNNFLETLEWMEDVEEGGEAAAECFVKRLEAFPTQTDQFIDLLRSGIAKKRTASKDMLRKVSVQIMESATGPGPIQDILKKMEGGDKKLLQRGNDGWIAFQAACKKLEKFLREEYGPHAREKGGCSGLPTHGAEIYALCLRFHTTTTMSPQEVHETGLREVRRIRDRYRDDVLVPLGMMSKEEAALKGEEGEKLFTSRFKTFVESARVEKDQYFDSEKALLDTYRGTVDRIAKVLPQGYFDTFPKSRVEIVSKNAPSSPAAYYMAGTPDGSRPGRFYVNVSNLKERPKYEMMSLSLHEAIPGHHHQVALAIENKKIPDFLRFLEDRRYEFCPARRQLYAAYLEGWALYCEALGEHMGLYGTPLELFGRLSMEMMRAVRLVVDSGIHHKGWTVHEAIEYMMEQTGMHRHEVVAECYRYESWPGQACSYKVGEIAIWKMRRYAERELGNKFSLPSFHNVILNDGPMPLDVLEERVKMWVEERK